MIIIFLSNCKEMMISFIRLDGEECINLISPQPQFKMMVKLHTWLKMPPPNEDMADLGEVVILISTAGC